MTLSLLSTRLVLMQRILRSSCSDGRFRCRLAFCAGLMRCHCCNGPMVLVSGTDSGYYGCYNWRRKTCTNALLVPRKRVEKVILSELGSGLLRSRTWSTCTETWSGPWPKA